ncbi:hypothetical protein C8A03DRAFT_46360 [Achaetomium macrosporum]|uniref:NACHT domain-containing protein n=1 Tax=Achaetomium macrosporum TaxID=79813 RepID=A0AAN7HBV1_9PEZI|nr:hypothetical protein C8A03DRAFT_46360 [Achaetomium macrosporum]
MEALAALGVAAAVVQFVDFVGKLGLNTHEIFHSARGHSADDEEVEEVYQILARLSLRLAQGCSSDPATTNGTGDPTDIRTRDLRELALKCKADCDAILSAVRSATPPDGKHKLWRSVKASVKKYLGKRRIAELEASLGRRQALRSVKEKSRELEVQQDAKLDVIIQGIGRLKLGLEKSGSDSGWPDDEKKLSSDKIGEISSPSVPSRSTVDFNDRVSRARLFVNSGSEGNTVLSTLVLEELIASLTASLSAKTEARIEQKILASLSFSSRPTRHAAVPVAHQHTFRWIYETHFADWLGKDSGVFWITGKAGSGKSTLLKFLADNETTKNIVDEWAKPERAVTASHFFWSTGTDMQKSYLGLLRTLLFGILKECPSMISEVFPRQWMAALEDELEGQPSWTMADLLDLLRKVAISPSRPAQFCLFIDGLDEFEGDPYDLCKTLKTVSQFSGFKICLSSRPLNVFEDFFGKNPATNLAIHHQTKQDIRAFAQSRLEDHPRWREWSFEGGTKDQLINDIAERAEGVFLWAFLVTRSLREGFSNDDSLTDLRTRLDSLPNDLESLFKGMLNRVDEIYHPKMAGILEIALRAISPLRWEIYAYHEQEHDDSKFFIKLPTEPITEDEYLRRYDQTRRRINARTMGLLEVDNHFSESGHHVGRIQRVQFLHRTVRDFLRTTEMENYISSKLKAGFDAPTSICKAHVVWIKSTRFVAGTEWGPKEDLSTITSQMLAYVSQQHTVRPVAEAAP